jgi:S-adenosylmethionine decarboxylase proenzyme
MSLSPTGTSSPTKFQSGTDSLSSGKHLICDIKNIKNESLMNDINGLKNMLDTICERYLFTILNKAEHCFTPQGITILYLLSESHISVHTFPERNYIAMDIYTCKDYPNNDVYVEIQNYLTSNFDSSNDRYIIIDREY